MARTGSRGGLGRLLRRRGITRGLLGASNLWLLIGVVAWGVRALRRASKGAGEQQTVRIGAGQGVWIRHRPER